MNASDWGRPHPQSDEIVFAGGRLHTGFRKLAGECSVASLGLGQVEAWLRSAPKVR